MKKDDYIFGTRAVIEAIRSGRNIEKVFLKKGLDNSLFSELFRLIKDNNVPFQFVPVEKINRITRKNHQGVLAYLSAIEYGNLDTLIPGLFEKGVDPFILVLDQVTDVRNLGAIVRTAECGGVNAIVIPDKGVARIGADAVKTSAGAVNLVPICREKNLEKTLNYLKNSGVKIVAATEKTPKIYTTTKMDGPIAIVMGSEDKGVSPALLNLVDEQIGIPLFGKIESLNVSVAAAIIIYEVVRQRS